MTSAQGKTVIVTGAAGGLGKAIATAFLDAGANVVICDVSTQRLASVEEEWTKSYANKFLAQETDVTDEAAVQKLVDAAVSKFGRLDALINNAGVLDGFEPVGALSREKWDRVLNINLNGPFLTTRAAIAQFEKQEPAGGVIINIGSIASTHGFKSGAVYTVSKAALAALTKNTAGFYGDKGIYSICLMLGGMFIQHAQFNTDEGRLTQSDYQAWRPTSQTRSPRGYTWRCSRRSRPRRAPPPPRKWCRSSR